MRGQQEEWAGDARIHARKNPTAVSIGIAVAAEVIRSLQPIV